MNYVRVYARLIERAQTRDTLVVYAETHHILPRCLGGTNERSNLVQLTAEEHYLAHQLLVRMHPGNGKLIWAAIAMTEGGRSTGRRGNKLYGWLRREFAERQRGRKLSEETKSKIGESSRERNQGERHPMHGRSHTAESRQQMSENRRGRPSPHAGKALSDIHKARLSASQIAYQQVNGNVFAGRSHSEESRAKMRSAWEQRRLKKETAA